MNILEKIKNMFVRTAYVVYFVEYMQNGFRTTSYGYGYITYPWRLNKDIFGKVRNTLVDNVKSNYKKKQIPLLFDPVIIYVKEL